MGFPHPFSQALSWPSCCDHCSHFLDIPFPPLPSPPFNPSAFIPRLVTSPSCYSAGTLCLCGDWSPLRLQDGSALLPHESSDAKLPYTALVLQSVSLSHFIFNDSTHFLCKKCLSYIFYVAWCVPICMCVGGAEEVHVRYLPRLGSTVYTEARWSSALTDAAALAFRLMEGFSISIFSAGIMLMRVLEIQTLALMHALSHLPSSSMLSSFLLCCYYYCYCIA